MAGSGNQGGLTPSAGSTLSGGNVPGGGGSGGGGTTLQQLIEMFKGGGVQGSGLATGGVPLPPSPISSGGGGFANPFPITGLPGLSSGSGGGSGSTGVK